MSKRAYLIHGWASSPRKAFHPWLKKKLEERGYHVYCPELPDAEHPDKNQWIATLHAEVVSPDEDTLLIGHSLSCLALLLYLQELGEESRVGKLILVAPVLGEVMGLSKKEKEMFKPWFYAEIDFQKIQKNTNEITVFFDDTDPWIPLENSILIAREKLSAKIIIEHAKAHFSDEEGRVEVPSVLEEIVYGV